MADKAYPRDLHGYGRQIPDAQWPNGARVAVQFVINYEEGAENCVLHGDAASEAFLSEIVAAEPIHDQRHMNMESLYEYGARAGFWRLHRLFTSVGLPVTVFGVAMALERNPGVVAAMQEAEWEIASHGYRWIDYQCRRRDTEREHLAKAIEIHTQRYRRAAVGLVPGSLQSAKSPPRGRRGRLRTTPIATPMTCRTGTTRTRTPQLMVPYTLDANDMRFHDAAGLQFGAAVLRLPERFLRRVARGRVAHDVRWFALPYRRPSRACGSRGAIH